MWALAALARWAGFSRDGRFLSVPCAHRGARGAALGWRPGLEGRGGEGQPATGREGGRGRIVGHEGSHPADWSSRGNETKMVVLSSESNVPARDPVSRRGAARRALWRELSFSCAVNVVSGRRAHELLLFFNCFALGFALLACEGRIEPCLPSKRLKVRSKIIFKSIGKMIYFFFSILRDQFRSSQIRARPIAHSRAVLSQCLLTLRTARRGRKVIAGCMFRP